MLINIFVVFSNFLTMVFKALGSMEGSVDRYETAGDIFSYGFSASDVPLS